MFPSLPPEESVVYASCLDSEIRYGYPMHRFLISTLLLVSIPLLASAQASNDIFKLNQILRGYTETYGGFRDVNRLASVSIEGVQVQEGVEYSFDLHKKRPDSIRYQLERDNATLTSVYNGEQGWLRIRTENKISVEELFGANVEMLKKEARFESPLYRHQEKNENTISLVGRERVAEADVYILRVEEPLGVVSLYFLHPENYHILRIDRLNDREDVVFQTLYRDYREVGGYPFAHEVEIRVNGETVSLTRVDSVTVNPGLLSFYFERPVR